MINEKSASYICEARERGREREEEFELIKKETSKQHYYIYEL